MLHEFDILVPCSNVLTKKRRNVPRTHCKQDESVVKTSMEKNEYMVTRNCSKLRKIHSGQGPISLTINPSEFKFFGKFVLLWFKFSRCQLISLQFWHMTSTIVLIKFLPYPGATAQTRSVALWGVSGSYGQAPAQQGMSGLVRETSHLWLYSSPSPSLQPILREPATSILIVLYTFECIMWVAIESLWRYVQGNK